MTQSRKASFLFLQGPCGPFFRRLGRELNIHGHTVLKVNFNGGDYLQWPGKFALNYQGMFDNWPEFLHSVQKKHSLTDLCVFNDSRPYHQVAIQVLKQYGVRVHVFEEGYFRPRWITLEREGVNANSRMPRNPEYYLQTVEKLPSTPSSQDIGRTPRHFFRHYFNYFLATGGLGFLFPQYKQKALFPDTLRLYPSFYEVVGDSLRWGCRLLGSRKSNNQAAQHINWLKENNLAYFLVPLQLSIDTQITCHSPFAGMQDFIAHVVESFARNAPENTILIFKNHPLDPNVRSNRMVAEMEAFKQGIFDRIICLDGGNLPEILEYSQGAILNNSTTGLTALHHQIPCIALGDAVYDMPGLTHQKGLDQFWKEPEAPDKNLYRAFRKVFMHRTQINGGFYTPKGLELAVQGAKERLLSQTAEQKDVFDEPLLVNA